MVIEKLKKIFRKKGVSEKPEEINIVGTCVICNQPIYKGDTYKRFEYRGTTYFVHQKCLRKAKKIAKKLASKGIVPKLPFQ